MSNIVTMLAQVMLLRRRGFLQREWETYAYSVLPACKLEFRSRNELCLEYSLIILCLAFVHCFSLPRAGIVFIGILWEYTQKARRSRTHQAQATQAHKGGKVWKSDRIKASKLPWNILKSTGSTDLKSLKIETFFSQSWVILHHYHILVVYPQWQRDGVKGHGMPWKESLVGRGRRPPAHSASVSRCICPQGVEIWKPLQVLVTLVTSCTSWLDSFTIFHALQWLHHTTLWLHCDSVMITSLLSWLWLLHAKSATNSIETKLQWCHHCQVGEAFEVSQLFSLAISCCTRRKWTLKLDDILNIFASFHVRWLAFKEIPFAR